jgi:hypothetical protein
MTGVFNVAAKLMADTANPCAGCSFGMTSERKAQANRANAAEKHGSKNAARQSACDG